MASTSSTIRIIFDGATRGIEVAAARTRAAVASISDEVDRNEKVFSKVGKGLATFGKVAVVLSALSGTITLIAGVTAALQNLLPIALLAPAAILSLGAAYATLKIGLSGVGDAIKSGDVSKLAPQAAAAVTAIRALGPAFDQVKKATQNALFTNFAADVKAIGATYLPVLQQRLPAIASGFNAMGRSVAFALTRPDVSQGIDIVLVNTAKLIHNARNALGAFVTGFILLGRSGSTYLGRVGVAIDGVAQRFQRFAERITSDGSFQRFVENAVQGFRDLFNIIGDVSAIVGSIFSGLAGPQGDVLGNLRQTTEALRAFFEAASTQTALGALGEALRVVGDAVRSVLLAALEQLAPIIENLAPVVAEIATGFGTILVNAIGIVGPLLVGLTGFLKDHKEIVGIVADALLILYGRFLLFKGIAFVAGALGGVTRALGGLRGVLKVGAFAAIGALAVEIDKLNVAAAGGDPAKLTGLAENLHDLVGAGQEIATLDFKKIFGEISDQMKQTSDTWDKQQAPIQQNYQKFVDTTKTSLEQVGTFFSDLGTTVSDRTSAFVETTRTTFDQVGTFLSDAVTAFQEFPGQVAAAIGDKASEIWTGFLESARTAFQPVRDFFAQSPYEMGVAVGEQIGQLINVGIAAATALRDGVVTGFETVLTFFREAPGRCAEALGTLAESLRLKAVEAWEAFRTAAAEKITATVAEAQALPGRTGDAIASLASLLATKAREAWESFKAAVVAKFLEIVAFVAGLPGRIISALSPLPAQAGTKGTETGTGFKNGLTTAFEAAVSYVRGIPGAIVSALGNVGGLLVGAGRALMDGLLAGIRAGFQATLDFARGIAAGIAAVKGPLPYDRVVLKPNGLALMDGLLAGIRSGNARVQSYASTIAGDLAGTLAAGSIISSAADLSAVPAASPVPDLLRQLVAASADGRAPVHVYIGETELTELVDTRVSTSNRATARTVRQGAGIAY